MKKAYVILGAGGFAREVACYIFETFNHPDMIIVFVDDFTDTQAIILGGHSYPVIKDWNFESISANYDIQGFTIGVGEPKLKESMVQKALQANLKPSHTIIHPKANISNFDNYIGVGGVVCPGVAITTNVKIGDYVILNLNCTVGHDATINDYVTANPGCHISGNTFLDVGVSLGTGTTLREKINICKYVTTGAQSCVVKHIDVEGIIVTGVPAKQLSK